MQSYNEQAMEEQGEYAADEELEESQTMANESEEVCCEFNRNLKELVQLQFDFVELYILLGKN